MTKRRQRPYAPAAQEDWGPDTPAAKAGTIVERVAGDANGRQRRRRLMPWEDPRGLGGKLSERQARAAAKLHEVHAVTQRSPQPSMIFVDRSPDYGLSAVEAMRQRFERAAVWRHVPSAMAALVFHVCAEARPLRCAQDPYSRDGKEAAMHTAQLQVALDIVANAVGL